MKVSEIHERVERYCDACSGDGAKCDNQECHLWRCRTADLAKDVSIETVSDAVMFICRSCFGYNGHCFDHECALLEIPTEP